MPHPCRVAGYDFPYPSGAYALDVAACFFYAAVEWFRIFTSSLGNRTEQVGALAVGLGLLAVSILSHVYLWQLQTYVCVAVPLPPWRVSPTIAAARSLHIEVVLNVIAVVLLGLEAVLSVIAAILFWGSNRF